MNTHCDPEKIQASGYHHQETYVLKEKGQALKLIKINARRDAQIAEV